MMKYSSTDISSCIAAANQFCAGLGMHTLWSTMLWLIKN